MDEVQRRARPKTARQVLDLMTTANGRNSNFLLNVGPNNQGRFEEASVKVLKDVGASLARPTGKE
jgi:alpha-L-fucosidase